MKFRTSLLILGVSALAPLWALEIPLGGQTESSQGAKIGYVDMDRIFQIYPQTLVAKEDYAKQLQKKKEQLADKESQLKDLENRIKVLESTLKDLSAGASSGATAMSASTPTAAGNESQTLGDMKKDLDDKRADLLEMRKQAAKDLDTFQNQQSQLILGKIYQALKDLAVEEQVSVVVDKSSILYGDATIDLTDRLQQRVRGY